MPTDVTLTAGSKTGVVSFGGQVSGDDTVTIGDHTYTFKASPSAADEVDIGSDQDESLTHLAAAINADADESGDGFHGDTVANEYVTATADTDNDELDLDARYPGNWVNGLAIAVSGTNLTANGAQFSAVSGGTDGAGRIEEYIDGLLDLSQVPSSVYSALAAMTEEEQDNYDSS